MTYPYTPYYCEENIYLLAGQLGGSIGDPLHVLFITNPDRSCALMHQRAAGPEKPVFWDYHVILLAGLGSGAQVWDLDTRLDLPCAAPDYLEQTFSSDSPMEYRPLLRMIPAEAYLGGFSSDRRHMRAADGAWLKPPPAWPCLLGKGAASPHELGRILDLGELRWGPIYSVAALKAKLGFSGG